MHRLPGGREKKNDWYPIDKVTNRCVIFLSSDIVFCLPYSCTYTFACFRKKASVSLKKTSKTSGDSKNIKEMFVQASPAIAPPNPSIQPSVAPDGSPGKVASEPSAMEVDLTP